MTFEEWYGSLLPFERKCLTREEAFQAGAASRDAEVAQWQRIIDEEAKDSALVIIERDQLRTELAAALAACKMKDETLQELDQLIPVGATIAALAIQPDDAALKAFMQSKGVSYE